MKGSGTGPLKRERRRIACCVSTLRFFLNQTVCFSFWIVIQKQPKVQHLNTHSIYNVQSKSGNLCSNFGNGAAKKIKNRRIFPKYNSKFDTSGTYKQRCCKVINRERIRGKRFTARCRPGPVDGVRPLPAVPKARSETYGTEANACCFRCGDAGSNLLERRGDACPGRR